MKRRTILDLRGLVLHSLHSITYADEAKVTASGVKINSLGQTLAIFIDRYLLPATEDSRLNDIIAVQDAGNDYRTALYPSYKAHRKAVDDEELTNTRREAVRVVLDLLKCLGIPIAHVPGTEADDVIAYLVRHLQDVKFIHTVDQDLLQLNDDNTAIFLKEVMADDEGMKVSVTAGDFYVRPKHIALYLSLIHI